MACMKLGSKADVFQKKGQAWYFPLLSRSGVMEKLIADASEKGDANCTINLKDIPGGAKTFELVAKFYYGVKHEITASNVVHLRCAAEHLEMTEQYGEDNLISQTEIFFNQVVLKNWKDSLKCLQTCGDKNIIPHAEELNITKRHTPFSKRCIESLAVKASTNPNLFGWPMFDHGGPMQSPSGSLLWNGISTGARPVNLNSDRWFDDVSSLTLPLYKKLTLATEARGIE
ncbi:putative chromatin remodeling & transcription regulator BTB-POZ family [Helianthus annuus]|nr:putative chromatin remodeling & transcription regulator BTB-POZ family [Helianthus annuus]